jgi:hypothetical protein
MFFSLTSPVNKGKKFFNGHVLKLFIASSTYARSSSRSSSLSRLLSAARNRPARSGGESSQVPHAGQPRVPAMDKAVLGPALRRRRV